MEKEALLMNL